MLSYSGTQMMAPSERLGLLDDMETFINEHRVVPENERGSLSLRQPPKLSPDLVNLPPLSRSLHQAVPVPRSAPRAR